MAASAVDEPVGGDDPDGRLLLAARSDPEAFGRFYDRTSESVLRYFYVRTADAHTAADLCAETYAEALAGVHRFRPDAGTGRMWLQGIARHLFHQYLRKEAVSTRARRKLGVPSDQADRADLDRIEALVDLVPLASKLAKAVGGLTPTLRDAILLRVVEELSYEQIAQQLGCTPGTARVRVSRGLHQIADQLADEA